MIAGFLERLLRQFIVTKFPLLQIAINMVIIIQGGFWRPATGRKLHNQGWGNMKIFNWAVLSRTWLLIVLVFLLAVPGTTLAASHMEVIAEGLNNPRGLNFGPTGALYVAEAGTGGECIPIEYQGEQTEVCVGNTGSITRIYKGEQVRIAAGLPSLAGGADGAFTTGAHDIFFMGNGNAIVVTGLGADPAARMQLGDLGKKFGRLLTMKPNGKLQYRNDISAYESAANPDGGLVLALPGKQIVVDAGANALFEVSTNGKIKTLAVFPDRIVPVPPLPFLPPGVTEIPMQSVPTTVALGPDGAYYVGELTGFPFPAGEARIYRVVPGSAPEVFADGFTAIIDIAFAPDGSLYVLEIAANGLLEAELNGDFAGALIKVAPDGTRTTVASEGLVLPGGVAVGKDGYVYVTNYSTFPGMGQVLKIMP
jgi:hypothetical protein